MTILKRGGWVGGMKVMLTLLFFLATHNTALASEQLNLDNPVLRDKVIAGAIQWSNLQVPIEEGQLTYEENKSSPYSGYAVDYYENGKIRELTPFVRGHLDGIRYNWFKDGKKHSENGWKESKPHGQTKTWYENGRL